MEASKELISFIKKIEQLRLLPYNDQFGNMAIGYGHTCKEGDFEKITEVEACNLLRADVTKYVIYLNKFCFANNYCLKQHEFDAVISLIFNCPIDNKTLHGLLCLIIDSRNNKEVTKRVYFVNLAQGNFCHSSISEIPKLLFFFRCFIKSGNTPVLGLYKRRTFEYYMCVRGKYEFTSEEEKEILKGGMI